MSDVPYRMRRVGERRPRRIERQNPYYRSHSRPLLIESCAHQTIDGSRQHQTNEWSRRALNEDALCPSPSQEMSRSRRHSDRYWDVDVQRTSLKSPSHSTLRNCYLPNTHKDFRTDIFQDFSGQRSAEMAYSNRQRIQSTRSKVTEQYLAFDQQRAGSKTVASASRSWSDVIEQEELVAEQHNSDFETRYDGLCPEQMNQAFDDISVQVCTSSHVRQDSMVSNPSSLGSDSTAESKKIRMSATPRFTESELNTKEVQSIVARRKKQIEYGKVLDCYHRYNRVVPRHKRTKYHPRTPDIYRSYSRRGFDTLIRTWKKQLHAWEPADTCGRSMKLGSTCDSSMSTDATEAVGGACKTEIKEDLDDCDYDSEFPPVLPSSATVKTESGSELHSVESSVTMKAEGSDDDTSVCRVVVKTEKPDDFLFDESCN